jgi:hypothetical protein
MNQNRLQELLTCEEILLDGFLKPIVMQSLKQIFDEELIVFILENSMISKLYNQKNIVLSFDSLDYVVIDLNEKKGYLLEFTGEIKRALEKTRQEWLQEANEAKVENDSYDEESGLSLASLYEKIINDWSSAKQFVRINESI